MTALRWVRGHDLLTLRASERYKGSISGQGVLGTAPHEVMPYSIDLVLRSDPAHIISGIFE